MKSWKNKTKEKKMKKTMFVLGLLALAACAESGTKEPALVRLNAEPKNCEYLYMIDTNVSSYDIDDAYNFIEKRIVEENKLGDSYFIYTEDMVKNVGAILGPRNTYKIKAKVYNCKK